MSYDLRVEESLTRTGGAGCPRCGRSQLRRDLCRACRGALRGKAVELVPQVLPCGCRESGPHRETCTTALAERARRAPPPVARPLEGDVPAVAIATNPLPARGGATLVPEPVTREPEESAGEEDEGVDVIVGDFPKEAGSFAVRFPKWHDPVDLALVIEATVPLEGEGAPLGGALERIRALDLRPGIELEVSQGSRSP